ncbi:hypothetical protein [Streptomyces sp. SP18BB07]|uniref:hypothetical protein n=1 Tax=Streptomyces sp. SP18BB07 TaxID=3002522 RepID=UPI002E790B28|nr:hypothetical protein [Streptomyces sp. SP18BB07]MEE1762710.1 hypothetical protein [Streptomyces sp. SP18BB07]
MSLTSQLRDGELSKWCARRFTGSAEAVGRLAGATRGRRPVFPSGQVDGRHWASIGGAFGARLAALVQPAPPYYALHGLVAARLVSREWVNEQAALYPTHADLGERERARALDLRPTMMGWLDLCPLARSVPSRHSSDTERADFVNSIVKAPRRELDSIVNSIMRGPNSQADRYWPAEPVLADLFTRTRAYFAQHAPPGRLGTRGAEAGLARVCWLLDMFEDVYRSGTIHESMHQVFRPGVPTVETIRAAANESVVDELALLARQTEVHGALAELRRLAGDPPEGQPLGIASPVFVNHWADGDLLISGPTGATLIDVKTVARVDKQDRSVRWLWQLIAYAWLDIADRYRIRDVGLYLARHGALVTWSLDSLAGTLLRGGDQDEARAEFRALAERVLTKEGARLPGADADLLR